MEEILCTYVSGRRQIGLQSRWVQMLGTALVLGTNPVLIGNESLPIQLSQCRFPGLAISNAKY